MKALLVNANTKESAWYNLQQLRPLKGYTPLKLAGLEHCPISLAQDTEVSKVWEVFEVLDLLPLPLRDIVEAYGQVVEFDEVSVLLPDYITEAESNHVGVYESREEFITEQLKVKLSEEVYALAEEFVCHRKAWDTLFSFQFSEVQFDSGTQLVNHYFIRQ